MQRKTYFYKLELELFKPENANVIETSNNNRTINNNNNNNNNNRRSNRGIVESLQTKKSDR